MDRNLGALDDKSHENALIKCKLYQFGRKDPFNANIYCWTYNPDTFVSTKTSSADGAVIRATYSDIDDQYHTNGKNVPFAVNNPRVVIYRNSYWTTGDAFSQSANIWNDPYHNLKFENEELEKNADKSFFDPCPVGWKIPEIGAFSGFVGDSSGSATGSTRVNCQWNVEDDANGKHRGSYGRTYFPNGYLNERNNPDPQTAFFPPTGLRHSSSANFVYGYGGDGSCYLYANRVMDANKGQRICLTPTNAGSFDSRDNRNKSETFAVRCVKE